MVLSAPLQALLQGEIHLKQAVQGGPSPGRAGGRQLRARGSFSVQENLEP